MLHLPDFTNQSKIVPFPVPTVPSRPYNLQASETGCDIARIFSKVDKKKLHGKDFKEHKTSRVGTGAHKLFNGQHVEDYLHNRDIPRYEYCEKTIYYTTPDGITIKGHADGILKSEDGNAVGVIDQKRAKFGLQERPYYLRQTITYAMGVCQELGLKPNLLFAVLTKRPYIKSEGDYRRKRFSISIVENSPENPKIKKIHEELKRSHYAQRELINNKDAVEMRKAEEAASKTGCIKIARDGTEWPCFSLETCNYIRRLCQEQGKSIIEILRELDVVEKDWEL